MIRRWIPKGTPIDDISKDFIKRIEDWLNNYPRAMFDYKSSNMILLGM
jgi:IS30 family transposase